MNKPKRSASTNRSEDPATIAAVAAAWLGLRDGGLTPQQEAELASWLDGDKRHADVFAELAETWSTLDQLSAARPAGDAVPDPALLIRGRRSWLKIALPATLAAAAAIAPSFATWSRPTRTELILEQHAATEVGVQQTLGLPDGSTVRLNTDSAVEVNYFTTGRRVRLVRGEAHFTVAKNPARPFIVTAGRVDVKAVGTAFNVRLAPEAVQVLVTEGQVRIDDARKGESLLQARASSPPLLVAGERAEIRAETTAPVLPVAIAAPEIERALAWHERRLEFAATPLTEVVAEFNRYNRHKLVIADPRLATRKFGGTFRADGYEVLVRLLEIDFGVVAERHREETVLRIAR